MEMPCIRARERLTRMRGGVALASRGPLAVADPRPGQFRVSNLSNLFHGCRQRLLLTWRLLINDDAWLCKDDERSSYLERVDYTLT
jgi:hypothetical protein